MIKNKPNTLCWDCKKALCGCSWSLDFIPVNGWTAEPTVMTAGGIRVESYMVTACPEFEADDQHRISEQNHAKRNRRRKGVVKMVKVYGVSDDLVEIEGSRYKEDEIDCYEKDVRISFVDGTVIRVSYGKPIGPIWAITVEKKGTAPAMLRACSDPDAEVYSDIFEIMAEIKSICLIEQGKEQKA